MGQLIMLPRREVSIPSLERSGGQAMVQEDSNILFGALVTSDPIALFGTGSSDVTLPEDLAKEAQKYLAMGNEKRTKIQERVDHFWHDNFHLDESFQSKYGIKVSNKSIHWRGHHQLTDEALTEEIGVPPCLSAYAKDCPGIVRQTAHITLWKGALPQHLPFELYAKAAAEEKWYGLVPANFHMFLKSLALEIEAGGRHRVKKYLSFSRRVFSDVDENLEKYFKASQNGSKKYAALELIRLSIGSNLNQKDCRDALLEVQDLLGDKLVLCRRNMIAYATKEGKIQYRYELKAV